MDNAHETETEHTDVVTLLGALADRLRMHGQAVRGIAAETTDDRTSHEARTQAALAGDLDATAARLDLLRAHLCPGCEVRVVVERVEIERESKHEKRGRRSRRKA